MKGKIIIRAVTDNDPISHIIRGGELGFWASHVETITPDGYLLGAHYDGGVAKRARDYDKDIWLEETFITIPTSTYQARAFYDFANSKIGLPYDMEAIKAL